MADDEERLGPFTVPTSADQMAEVIVRLANCVSGGDRQLIAALYHFVLGGTAHAWFGTPEVGRERHAEVTAIFERVQFSCLGLSPSQLLLMAAFLCLEATKRQGEPVE